MTIANYSQWDGTTAANNVDLNDIPLVENNMYPRHVNNAFREMMKQLKASTGLGGLFAAWTAASASGAASLDFHEDTDNGTNRVRLQGAASTADVTLTLPAETATIQTRVASTTDHAIVRFDSTAGVQQNSTVIVDDSGNMSGVGTLAAGDPTFTKVDDGNAGATITTLHNSISPLAADLIGRWLIQGKDGGGNNTTFVQFRGVTLDPTDGNEDGSFDIVTVVAGANAARITVQAGVQVGAPTGGDKGAGTLNANAVYDDNTLLSCYPFDAYLDGTIDEAKWDALVPDREVPAFHDVREVDTGKKDGDGKPILRSEQYVATEARVEPRRHDDMRKFKARLGTDTDPLDLDKYIAHWREKRHLTSLPNEATFDPLKGMPTGAWIQRLIETVEIQAIHISQLHDRLKAVEAARSR